MEEEYKLLKTQKNYVFKVLQRDGLEPGNFSWRTNEAPDTSVPPPYEEVTVPRLECLNGEYYFQFEPNSCMFSPGETQAIQCVNDTRSDEQLYDYVGRWVGYLKREVDAPDLWTEMEKYKVAFSLVPAEKMVNEPIPTYEAERISEKLNLLADKIEKQFELMDEQNEFVHSKLNYLAEAVKRQRSVDFVYTVIGVSVTIAMGLALTPDRATELWELMKSLMGAFIHLIGT